MSTQPSRPLTVPKTITSLTVRRAEAAFKQQLRDADSLVSFEIFPIARLRNVVYPCEVDNIPIPLTLDAWEWFTHEHHFLEDIYCFCSLRTGESQPVRVFEPRTPGENFGKLCLGCRSWRRRRGKTSGCSYFVNLTDLFQDYPVIPCKQYPRKEVVDFGDLGVASGALPQVPPHPMSQADTPQVEQSQARADALTHDIFGPLGGHNSQSSRYDALFRGQDPLLPTGDRSPLGLRIAATSPARVAMRNLQASTADDTELISSQPWMALVCEGFVTSADRLSEVDDASAFLDFRRVHDLPVPDMDETVTALLQLFSENPGIKWCELMEKIGSCKICAEVVALAAFPMHRCARPLVDDINTAAGAVYASSTPTISPASSPARASSSSSPARASSSTLATPSVKEEDAHENLYYQSSLGGSPLPNRRVKTEQKVIEVIDLSHDEE